MFRFCQVWINLILYNISSTYSLNIVLGAERLINHLYDKNIPIAVATSSGKATFEVKTACYQNVFSKFHHIVLGSADSEVKQGKPAPDIFLICASRFDDKPLPEKVCNF